MTEEKFRQWIVILFALFILTMWAGIILKVTKKDMHPAMQSSGMVKRYPTMPTKRRMKQTPVRRPAAIKSKPTVSTGSAK